MFRLLLFCQEFCSAYKFDIKFGFFEHQRCDYMINTCLVIDDLVKTAGERHINAEFIRFFLDLFERIDTFGKGINTLKQVKEKADELGINMPLRQQSLRGITRTVLII